MQQSLGFFDSERRINLNFTIHRANRHHLADINRLIVSANIGTPMNELEGIFWIAKVDHKVVGCVGAEIVGEDVAVLTYLAVEKDYRKNGIGMSLFNHSIRCCLLKRGIRFIAFITMYYHFRRFKKRGFRVLKRQLLPEAVVGHWMFTAKKYMKCAAMIQEFA